MKVYLFYAKSKYIRNDDSKENEKELYAITNDKSIAKEFKSDRRDDIFSLVKDDVTEDEYKQIVSQNRECVLEKKVLHTIGDERYPETLFTGFGTMVKSVTMVMTFLEYQSMEDAKESYFHFKYVENAENGLVLITPYVFKKKVLKALDFFIYSKIFRSMSFPCIDFDFEKDDDNMIAASYATQKGIEDLDFDTPQFWTDELALFCELYAHLLK